MIEYELGGTKVVEPETSLRESVNKEEGEEEEEENTTSVEKTHSESRRYEHLNRRHPVDEARVDRCVENQTINGKEPIVVVNRGNCSILSRALVDGGSIEIKGLNNRYPCASASLSPTCVLQFEQCSVSTFSLEL